MDHKVEERLHDLTAREDYREADRVLGEYLARGGVYDDALAVYDGCIGQHLGDSERAWAAICQGLCFNPENYELYVMLGNYYRNRNLEQSWLCYEYAMTWCGDKERRAMIRETLNKLSRAPVNLAGRLSVVIWCHGSPGSVKPCVESVRGELSRDSRQIVVVMAGPRGESDLQWLKRQDDLILVKMEAGQDLSQVWEKGIAASWADADCLLMDSGTTVPKHALFWLGMALYSSDKVGTAGSMSSHVTNSRLTGLVKNRAGSVSLKQLARQINVPMRHPEEVLPWTKGAAVLIRRQVLVQAGIPRENFSDGVFMDRDYGRKVKEAGYRNLLCENSFLSYQREDGGHEGAFWGNRQTSGGRVKTRRFLLFYAGNERGYYQDTKHFTEEISRELCRRGHGTFIRDLTQGTHDIPALKDYEAAGVDAVITFNGEAIEEKGLWNHWNQLGALVVNILMDPPFHIDLCPYMENPGMEQYLLLCPDENHVEYVKSYFPQVKHVEFMPHGGTPVNGRPIPWKEKPMDLLFCGTYINPEKFLDIMRQNMDPEEFNIYTAMGEQMLQDRGLSVEQVVTKTRLSGNYPLTPGRVDEEIPKMNLLEGWMRMLTRERMVTALVEGGVDLYVLGGGWQDCPCAGKKQFHSLSKETIPFRDTLAWMENAKINLNIMPWFKAGSHDRVFNAMLRESVALTDPSTYFQQYFRDQESIVYYSPKIPDRLPEMARGLLAHPGQAEAIARTGYEKAAAFTWERYVEELLAKVERCLR